MRQEADQPRPSSPGDDGDHDQPGLDRLDRLDRLRHWAYASWTAVAIAVLAWMAWQILGEPLRIIMPPLLLAGIIVYLANPFVRVLNGLGLHRALGTTVAYLLFIGVVVGVTLLLGPPIANEAAEFADDVPRIAVELQDSINDRLEALGADQRVDFDPESVQDWFRRTVLGEEARLGVIVSGVGAFVGSVFRFLLVLILGPVLAFYMLIDWPRIKTGIKRLLPPDHRDEILAVTESMGGTVGSYFRGQLLVAAFVGVGTWIGMLVVSLPFAGLVGFVAGVTNLVPLIGPFVGGFFGALIALTIGDGLGQAVGVAVAVTIVQRIDNDVISPIVVGRSVRIHPAVVMLTLLVAGILFGIFGMLVAIPVVAAAKLVAVHLLSTRVPWYAAPAEELPPRTTDPGAPSPSGVLEG